jgi:hypothetical protein
MTAPRLVRTKQTGKSARGTGATNERPRSAARLRSQSQAADIGVPEVVPEDAIRTRAYFLSLERQRVGADPVRNWLDAEREVAGEAAGPARQGGERRRDA